MTLLPFVHWPITLLRRAGAAFQNNNNISKQEVVCLPIACVFDFICHASCFLKSLQWVHQPG